MIDLKLMYTTSLRVYKDFVYVFFTDAHQQNEKETEADIHNFLKDCIRILCMLPTFLLSAAAQAAE
jgi:hypothetical protein